MGDVLVLSLLALTLLPYLDLLGRVLAGLGGGIRVELSDLALCTASSLLPPGGGATTGPRTVDLTGEREDPFMGRFPTKPGGFGFLVGLPLLLVSEVLELTELSLLSSLSSSSRSCSVPVKVGVSERSRKSIKPDCVISEFSFAELLGLEGFTILIRSSEKLPPLIPV